jgi:serine/threonine protein kinase/class 3 adenylate cyclase
MPSQHGSPTVRIEIDDQVQQSLSALTVLFAEIVDSTMLLNHPGESSALETIRRHGETSTSIIQKHNGKVIKSIAGSVMAEFSDPASAVRAGVEIERRLQESNLRLPQNKQLELRIGIHASVDPRQGIDIFSDVVQVAARIVRHAGPMQILISSGVHEAILAESNLHCQWFSNVSIDGQTKEDVFEVNWADAPSNIPQRYEVLSQIGSGGMGFVYKVRDQETGEILALKILKPGIASESGMQESLKREVCLARKVTHKNVCRIHEFNRSNGSACISMEFVEGESLQSRLRHFGALPLNEAFEIMLQICAGLREAHLQGIVHRDLKPANIMLARSGIVKIMDFGIARSAPGNNQLTGTITGTPAYMAPEQLELKPMGAYTDIYALGLLLYEMVTGLSAFVGDNPVAVALKQIRDFPKRPREILPTLPFHAEATILKCLQKDPAKRFQSVDELDLALRKETKARQVVKSWFSIVPRLQRAGLEFQQLLRSGIKDAKPALSWWEAKLRHESQELLRIVRACARKTRVFVRQRDWCAMTSLRSQQALSGLGLVLVLGCVIAFGLARSGKRNSAALPQSAAAVDDQSFQSRSVAARISPITTERVDLKRGPDRPSTRASLSAPLQRGQVPASARMNSREDNASRSRAVSVHRPPLAVPPLSSSPATSVTSGIQVVETEPETLEVVSPPLDSTLTPTNESKPIDLRPGSTLYFLDVGSFKNATLADSAVEKLSQLGFHAVSVQKGHLWAQSHHVQVGPYTTPQDIEAAQQRLVLQGFKSHIVK